MATIHGKAGEWARVKGSVFGLWPLFLCAFALGMTAAVTIFVQALIGAILFVLVATVTLFALQRGMGLVERYFKGARGEERVAGLLQRLPDSYHIFNDFIACGKHIDHVVIGPAGVFAVETKYWRGKVSLEDGHILLDGQLPDHDPLAQTRREASLVKTQLTKSGWAGAVTPVLVFASDTFEAKIAECQGAVILNSNHIGESFSTGRETITPSERERLVRLMENHS